MDWNQYFVSFAYLAAMKSKDQSTHVGSVIVGPDREIRTTGYNSFPRGLNDDVLARQERPLKYSFIEHAERNAIYNAARIGVSCKGCVLYLTWSPCVDCARAIIQSGIVEVIVHRNQVSDNTRWQESMAISREMFDECGVKFTWWDGDPLLLSSLISGRHSRLGNDSLTFS